MGSNTWYCPDCSGSLGSVVAGELHISSEVSTVRTAGPNLVITCPKCGRTKVWYPSDPITRALNQLIAAFADESAKALAKKYAELRSEMATD